MPLEILNGSFVFLCRSLAVKRAEIFSFARSRIFLAGIQPILAGFQFPNHGLSFRGDRHFHFNVIVRLTSQNSDTADAA